MYRPILYMCGILSHIYCVMTQFKTHVTGHYHGITFYTGSRYTPNAMGDVLIQ